VRQCPHPRPPAAPSTIIPGYDLAPPRVDYETDATTRDVDTNLGLPLRLGVGRRLVGGFARGRGIRGGGLRLAALRAALGLLRLPRLRGGLVGVGSLSLDDGINVVETTTVLKTRRMRTGGKTEKSAVLSHKFA